MNFVKLGKILEWRIKRVQQRDIGKNKNLIQKTIYKAAEDMRLATSSDGYPTKYIEIKCLRVLIRFTKTKHISLPAFCVHFDFAT